MKLLDYIRGTRKGKVAHRLQKEAMRDSFLADAMDGYDGVGENQEEQIEVLRRRIKMKVQRKRKHHAIAWSVAASLLMGVCLSGYFLFQKDKLPEDALIALEQLQRDTVLQTLPQSSPQLPVKKEMELAKTSQKDSISLLISQDRGVKRNVATKVIVPKMKEKLVVEAEMNMALSEDTEFVDTFTVRKDDNLAKMLENRVEGVKAGEVKGRITDESGEPLVGANVLVKGTSRGTISDVNGNFALDADGNKEITVNYIGYEPVTLPVDSGKDMLIAMNESKDVLDEVVVVGYGREKKKSVTGSVASIEELIMPQPVAGFKAYRKYLKRNLIHPIDEKCSKIKGEVVLTFHVDKKGRPFDIKIKNSLCVSADKEAIRLVEEGPDWTVGNKEVTLNIKF